MKAAPEIQSRSSRERDSSAKGARRPKRHSRWLPFGLFLLILAVVAAVSRAILPVALRDYVNRTLDRNPLYSGKIGKIHLHLWRGAYSIEQIRLSKITADVPDPFFAAKRVDFAIQWEALLHHKLVGRVLMENPQLNFVDSPGGTQTGAGGPWLEMIRNLFPFTINRAVIQDGSVHFHSYKAQTPVDVYLSKLQGSIDNLSNVRDETKPLVATVDATGLAMDQAKFEYKMSLDPFSYRPTFHLALRLLGLDVTNLNNLALTYGKFDFKRGWFDLVIQTDAQEGQLTGYVKPLFRNLLVFSLLRDVKQDNPLQFFWQALIGATTTIFKNQPRDQFGTLIPFSGEASGTTSADILATIGNLLRNAFIRAYLPRLENPKASAEGIEFGAPDFTQTLSALDTQ